ncbi:MAG: hypothetical protein EOM37_08005 [Proteobacteria bacterium]|jgi:hypothetical protein|nr:type 4b pilus protein PilO2 [Alphaproteobacteria bacterium]NCC03969.1 hypothetical protein [Pseudomonadota bacterium]
MVAGLVTVGRKQYVAGLYWENSPGGRISQVAKEAARQPGNQADFYATRIGSKQGRVPQFGLVSAVEGLTAGTPSLAGCLANQQPGSWIGAFRFREGAAVVIVRDDLIVPDGDMFFADETEARDHLYQEMAVGGFQRIYAPEAWGVPGADTMPISLLLNDKTDVRVHGVALSKQAKTALGLSFVVLLAVIGMGWYIQKKQAEEEAMRLEQLATMERMKREAEKLVPGLGGHVEYPEPERKWEKQPNPLQLIEACRKSMNSVMVGVAGWDIRNIYCSRSGLQVSWSRSNKAFSSIPKGAAVADTGQNATSSVPLESLQDRGPETLVDPDVVTQRYLNQNWSGTIRREPDDPPPPPPPGYKGKWDPPPPPWVKRSFTLDVPVLPWTLPDFLSDIPGVVVKSMSLLGSGTSGRSSWKVEGVIYENRR